MLSREKQVTDHGAAGGRCFPSVASEKFRATEIAVFSVVQSQISWKQGSVSREGRLAAALGHIVRGEQCPWVSKAVPRRTAEQRACQHFGNGSQSLTPRCTRMWYFWVNYFMMKNNTWPCSNCSLEHLLGHPPPKTNSSLPSQQAAMWES